MNNVFFEFAGLLLISALAGAIAVRLRQPLIIAFIAVGILSGPAALGWVTAHDQIDLLAQLGVTLLLFAVGLRLDLHIIKNLGPVALATGIGQIVFTTVFGYLIASALGMAPLTALYVAVALTFSSTIIIVKLLSDKRELDSLHGRIAVGFLIVQDIAVVVAMMLMGATRMGAGGDGLGAASLSLLLNLVLVFPVLALLMRYVLPRVLHLLARSQELLLLFAIAWGVAAAVVGDQAGFGKEVGAFLAGFSLASSVYREAISARLTGIRDFLLLFFFIDLGAKLDFSALGADLPAAALLSLFVLIGNPLIVMAIMGYMGYRKRTGFLAGLTVAQISEFSVVFVAMGVSLGHIGTGTLSMVTLVGLVTIALSSYMILYSGTLYSYCAPWLGRFERSNPFRELAVERQAGTTVEADVIVYGLGRYGRRLAERLKEQNLRVLGVDFDPEVVRSCRRHEMDVRFGDAEDPAFPETLPLGGARWVVSTVPQLELNLALLGALRHHGYAGRVALTAHNDRDARRLAQAGADKVLFPFDDAADFAAGVIEKETLKKETES
ncbi:MAG: cation:proton antiporter [Sulfurisoma sp.]|nr:cation:proton antiporter [Sulfurisoma sp.]